MQLIDKIKKKYGWIYSRYRDYNYLRDNLYQTNGKKKIFIGSSYTLFGILPSKDNVILALQSQDIYYSYMLLKRYISSNKDKPMEVYLGLGYYALYHDLSMTKSIDENNRIFDIYYPLLNDLHNMPRERYELAHTRFSLLDRGMRLLIDKVVLNKRVNNYFNEDITRKSKSRKTWKDISKEWQDLSSEEKEEAANKRVKSHERLLKFENTCEENKVIIRKIKEICVKNNCSFLVFIAPMSEQYINSMSIDYKNKSNELMCFLRELGIDVLDFNTCNYFISEDFVDSDHLSESGAEKLSSVFQSGVRSYRRKTY